jgi:hypothetical protein
MKYNEYKEVIQNTPVTEGLEYNIAVAWVHPEEMPLKVVSRNGCTDRVIHVPETALNRWGLERPVMGIGKFAFKDCTDITDIILGSYVEILGSGAFSGCIALERIVIPKGLRRINKDAFAGCTALSDIYYGGTPDEWERITIHLEKHEYEYGELIPGTPVQKLTGERIIRIPGNVALKLANIHFHCMI